MASIIELETSRLRMRQWRESDRAPFAFIACIASPGRNGASMTP